MKIFIYVLIAVALGVIAINIGKLNPAHLLQGDSSIAVFGILSAMCAILVLCILLISRKISAKSK
ncbi:hypothetical protein EI546_11190 [Aequorivita sp. H23M31]|uniref:Uncharacterized protein n=1 Tax=Aequorivita ciconiae TaxID=2494375 RepID=A0A410G4T0_9FLAO|nr:hypothetical protein [Aequorivita sp. H23M31]QAA82249.1 hypothetical protein EI546_11190 [Aequorivita sp. H23M31]